MPKTIDRIMLLMKHFNLSARQFDKSIACANGYSLKMYKNKASVGSDIIERIIKTYPQVNLVWLITGKGDMLIEEKVANSIDINQVEALINAKIDAKITEEKKALYHDIITEIKKHSQP